MLNLEKPVPALAFFHIPLPEYRKAAADVKTVKILGTKGEPVHCSNIHSGMFVSMKEMEDVQAMSVGHDHNNDCARYDDTEPE